MDKIALGLMIAWACFFVGASTGLAANQVLLRQTGAASIHGTLPDTWRPMTAAELDLFSQTAAGLGPEAGQPVAGFKLQNGGTAPLSGPFILVLANDGPTVSVAEIQKTYSWFEKNRALTTGLLPAQVSSMKIENIEFLQDRAAILFQTGLQTADKEFSGVGGIIFLRHGYLNIIGLTESRQFSQHAASFYSLIKTIAVPAAQRYERPYLQGGPLLASRASTWLADNWQKILGAVLLVGVYGYVLRRQE